LVVVDSDTGEAATTLLRIETLPRRSSAFGSLDGIRAIIIVVEME
jgi:hypothetical protein